MLDALDIHRERDSLHMMAGNLMRMLEACRAQSGTKASGYTSSVVRMTCDSYRNALEAAMATISEVETECLLICCQRERDNAVYQWPRSLPSPRPTALPAVVSPCAAE